MPNENLAGSYYFLLNLGGAEAAGYFKECTGLTSESEVVSHEASDAQGKSVIQKFPGQLKWSNITLKRGVDSNLDLWKWREVVVQKGPADARVDGFIELVDYVGTPIARWTFIQAWPIKYSGATLNASGNEVAVEEIQICHEGLTRE